MSPVVKVEDLSVRYAGGVDALRHVSLELQPGEVVGVVGESGSGKSTLGRAILGLAPITSGKVTVVGVPVSHATGFIRRAPHIQCVFQDPYTSLDTRLTIESIVAEPLIATGKLSRELVRDRVQRLLDQVGLERSLSTRKPRELSGGQCQRVAIARAIALEPQVLICDEPTSSLDVSVQSQIVELFGKLRREMGVALVFISHDLAVVGEIADRTVVMYAGMVVEHGTSEEVFRHPTHPYTRELLASVPTIEGKNRDSWSKVGLEQEGPATRGGCDYAGRCQRRRSLGNPAACTGDVPPLKAQGHDARCHYRDLALDQVELPQLSLPAPLRHPPTGE